MPKDRAFDHPFASEITPPQVYRERRQLIQGAAALAAMAALPARAQPAGPGKLAPLPAAKSAVPGALTMDPATPYKDAVESHQRLVREFPDHPRTPEAMLALANSQVELKDTKGARRTLEDLVKQHPQSEAAGAAKERLARLK